MCGLGKLRVEGVTWRVGRRWCEDGKMTSEPTTEVERIEVERKVAADPATIFRLLCDPQGHVAIDSSGMLMAATG